MFRSNTRHDKFVRAALSTLYKHFGFCKDGRYVSTVHLDCADDVLNAPVRVLGGPRLLATSRLSRSSINILVLQNLTGTATVAYYNAP
jgi:hypothetical protein